MVSCWAYYLQSSKNPIKYHLQVMVSCWAARPQHRAAVPALYSHLKQFNTQLQQFVWSKIHVVHQGLGIKDQHTACHHQNQDQEGPVIRIRIYYDDGNNWVLRIMDREKHAGPCTRALRSRINKEQIIITNVFPPVHLDQLKNQEFVWKIPDLSKTALEILPISWSKLYHHKLYFDWNFCHFTLSVEWERELKYRNYYSFPLAAATSIASKSSKIWAFNRNPVPPFAWLELLVIIYKLSPCCVIIL